MYRLGKSYYHKQKYLKALDLFQQTLTIRREDYWSYYWQGECQQKLKQWENAKKSYQQALNIKHDDYWALLQVAKIYQKQCLYLEAIKYYEKLENLYELEDKITENLLICQKIVGKKNW